MPTTPHQHYNVLQMIHCPLAPNSVVVDLLQFAAMLLRSTR